MIYVLIIVIIALIPVFVKNTYYLNFLVTSAVMAVSVVGYDFLIGTTGYNSFAHAAFMGLGGYISAILAKTVGLNIWLSVIIAIIATGIVAYLLSFPVFRLKGMTFSIATLAFGQVFYVVVYNWDSVTKGARGIIQLKRMFPSLIGYYYFSFAALFIIGYAVKRFTSSPAGKAMYAIKENEKLAESVGVSTFRLKRFALVVSAVIAAFAGAVEVHLLSLASTASFSMDQSLEILVTAIMGGVGTTIGPGAAAFGLNLLSQLMAQFQELRLALYGLLLIFTIRFLPGGVAGFINQLLKNRKKIRSKQ